MKTFWNTWRAVVSKRKRWRKQEEDEQEQQISGETGGGRGGEKRMCSRILVHLFVFVFSAFLSLIIF